MVLCVRAVGGPEPFHSLSPVFVRLASGGYNINAKDCSSGKTALMALAQALPMERCPEEQVAQELNEPDGASLFLRQPYAAHLTRELLKRGADPTVVDNGGSTPLHYAAHKGQAALVSLYLQWAAATQKDPTLASLASSPFVSRINSYDSNALHYAFYCAHQTESHVDCIRALLSTGLSLDAPRNNLGRTPLQMFAAPNSETGIDVCSLVLKQSVRRVLDQIDPPKKAVKFKVLSSDLSEDKEPKYSIEVATELEPTAAELASLEAFSYSMANSLSVRAHESSIPMLNSDVTLCETVGRTQAGSDLSRSKRVQAKKSFDAEESDAENEDDDPAELRRRLNVGVAFPLCIRLTAKKGWGVFAKKDIPRDSFLFEYVGVLLSAAEGERRALQYMIEGRHHYSFTAVLMNLVSWRDLCRIELAQDCSLPIAHSLLHSLCFRTATCTRWMQRHRATSRDSAITSVALRSWISFCVSRHSASLARVLLLPCVVQSCDPNVGVYRVLDRTRIACFSLRSIKAGEELCIDYNFEKSYVTGPTFICACEAKECESPIAQRMQQQNSASTHSSHDDGHSLRSLRVSVQASMRSSSSLQARPNHPLCSRVSIASTHPRTVLHRCAARCIFCHTRVHHSSSSRISNKLYSTPPHLVRDPSTGVVCCSFAPRAAASAATLLCSRRSCSVALRSGRARWRVREKGVGATRVLDWLLTSLSAALLLCSSLLAALLPLAARRCAVRFHHSSR